MCWMILLTFAIGQGPFDLIEAPAPRKLSLQEIMKDATEPVVLYNWEMDFRPLGDEEPAAAEDDGEPLHWDVKEAPRPDEVPGPARQKQDRPSWAKTKTRVKEVSYGPATEVEAVVSRERYGRRGIFRGGLFRRGGRCSSGG